MIEPSEMTTETLIVNLELYIGAIEYGDYDDDDLARVNAIQTELNYRMPYRVSVAKWPNFDNPQIHYFAFYANALAFAKDAVRTPYTPVGIYHKGEIIRNWHRFNASEASG